MAGADSVSVFAEGTFEEQVQPIARGFTSYLKVAVRRFRNW